MPRQVAQRIPKPSERQMTVPEIQARLNELEQSLNRFETAMHQVEQQNINLSQENDILREEVIRLRQLVPANKRTPTSTTLETPLVDSSYISSNSEKIPTLQKGGRFSWIRTRMRRR